MQNPLRFPAAALVLAGLVLGACTVASGNGESSGFEEKSSQGEVSVRLTPRGVEEGQFLVEVRVDTHSGDLADLDLQKATALRVEGRTYRPTKAVRLGGHHSSGTLAFAVPEAPAQFEIVISGVRSMADVTFRWP